MNAKNIDIIGIIPARYHSTRLEGKPLLLIKGKPMIQHVYERAKTVIDQLIVATDDQRIADCVASFGGSFVMTDSNHSTGTNRCLEAFNKWKENDSNNASIIINIQGDEPLLNPSHIKKLIACFKDTSTTIATLGLQISADEKLNEGKVYLVKDNNDFALYFSRFPIPYLRDIPKNKWTEHHTYYQHIGIYGFRVEALNKFAKMLPSSLENMEKLEQLRWLESGEKIKVSVTHEYSLPVDTPEDLDKVRELFK